MCSVRLDLLQRRETFSSLHHILRLSSILMVIDGREYAVNRMDHFPQLTNARRLRVSLDYLIPRWFHHAARQLIETPMFEWTHEDIADAGAAGLARIIDILAKVYELRKQLILSPPEVSPPPCGQSQCAVHWAQAWRDRAIPLILATGPFSVTHVRNPVFMDLLLGSQHFCPSCWAEHLRVVEHDFLREEDLVANLLREWFQSVFFNFDAIVREIWSRSGLL